MFCFVLFCFDLFCFVDWIWAFMYFMLLYFVQHLVTAYERLSKNRYHSCYYIVIAVHPQGSWMLWQFILSPSQLAVANASPMAVWPRPLCGRHLTGERSCVSPPLSSFSCSAADCLTSRLRGISTNWPQLT